MRVAFLGLGIMGSRMAVHVARSGHDLRLWTRTDGKAQAWADRNAGEAFATPAQAAADADAVISMVIDGPQVQEILLGADGAASKAPLGTLFLDMSTIAPDAAVMIAAELNARGHRFIDAPVTGSSPAADSGTLTIMAGGEATDIDRAQPLLEAMGRTIVRCGPVGHGQLVKLLNNAVAVANALTAAQALVAGRAMGADLNALVDVLRAGSGGSAVLDLKSRPFLEHDYSTLFKTAHMLKDVRHCLDAVAAAGASFPAAAAAGEVLADAVDRGFADDDYASILEVVEAREGFRL